MQLKGLEGDGRQKINKNLVKLSFIISSVWLNALLPAQYLNKYRIGRYDTVFYRPRDILKHTYGSSGISGGTFLSPFLHTDELVQFAQRVVIASYSFFFSWKTFWSRVFFWIHIPSSVCLAEAHFLPPFDPRYLGQFLPRPSVPPVFVFVM